MLESLFGLLMSVGFRGSSGIRRVNLLVSHFYLGLAPSSSDNNRQTWRILLGGFILRVSYCPVKFYTGLMMMMMIANAQMHKKKYKKAPGKRSKKEENGGKGPWETRQTVSKAPRASSLLNLTGSRETALSLSSACLAACLYPMTLWAGIPSVQGLEMIHALSGALVHG